MIKTPSQPFEVVAAALTVLFAIPATAYAGECSVARTNKSCTLTIDRTNPLAPPTIQMYSGETVTIIVRNPYYFERYFADYQSGQIAVVPDVGATIISGLLTPLAKAAEFKALLNVTPEKRIDCSPATIQKIPKADVASHADLYRQCFAQFAADARTLYHQLEPFAAPDSRVPGGGPLTVSPQDMDTALQAIAASNAPNIKAVCAIEFELSASIAAAAKDSTDPDLLNLSALSAVADAIAKDLFSYAAHIAELPSWCAYWQPHKTNDDGTVDCRGAQPAPVSLPPIPDPQTGDPKQVTRQVTYNLDALNLLQNSREAVPDPTKKRTLAAITILYGDTRWEPSAGVFFSSLAVRSFAVSPVFTGNTVTDKQITQSVLHPTVVPFAAANYRVSRDFGGRWRTAVYVTGAVGINPNTTSADFAFGPSISWRTLMFSALMHYGHDVRLTQGLTVGESLGAGFSGSAPPTETYWRRAYAVGISVRVPPITGR